MDVSKLTLRNHYSSKVLYTRDVIANVRYFSSRVEIFELKHNSQVSFSINIEREGSF